MNQFHVGQKVVCIDDKFKNVSIDQGIRKGQIYTIRWIGPYKHYIDGEFIGIKLEEIHRGNDDGPEGYGAADMPIGQHGSGRCCATGWVPCATCWRRHQRARRPTCRRRR